MTFNEAICRAAEEGAVLLKNTDKVLPFTNTDRVAVFGRCQKDWYRSGMGSGGSVHVSYTTTMIDSLKEMQKKIPAMPAIDDEVADSYSKWILEHPFDNGGGEWAAEPWSQEEMPVSSDFARKASERNSKAVFVIGRTAGEDKDNKETEGSWLLSAKERQALENICAAFEDVCLVLNTSNIMDLSWTDDAVFKGHIKAVLIVWHGGQEGGRAAARLLCGLANPSGKLTDTIAKKCSSYPCTENFGIDGDIPYSEDIYVGYRYFSTFAPDEVLYPFGFGLSYTTFSLSGQKAHFADGKVTLLLTVTNTGNVAGKETVQVYVQCPQGKLGKSARELAAFRKTGLLESGASESVSMEFPLSQLASYDDSGVSGNPFCFVLEEGIYRVYIGCDVASAEEVLVDGSYGIRLDSLQVISHHSQAAAPVKAFSRIRPESFDKKKSAFTLGKEDTPLSQVDLKKRILSNLPKEIAYTGDKGIRFADVIKDKSKLDAFIAQISDSDLAAMVRGEGMMSQKVTVGIAAAYGGITQKLRDFGIPAAGCSDGPSGIRLDTGKEADLMPIGTLLACTWNPKLVEELYVFEGKELVQYEIDSLLGPGVNIHRSPLNGRNFEYYSEDPYLSGVFARATLRGLNIGGASGTIKHFAANNQEFCRRSTNALVSERALREIYLKPFEIAVRSGEVKSLMTSYNAVNGHWCASNYDLVTTILRKEWGYKGLVMTDWWASMNDCVAGGKESVRNTNSLVRSGNDVYMVVENDGAERNAYKDNTMESLQDGSLTRAELHAATKNILTFILLSPVSKRPLRPLKIFKTFKSQLDKPAEGTVVEEDEIFLPENGIFYLHACHDAMYNISGTYSKEGDDLSQSVTNILIDGSPAASLDCRSTAGIETTVNAAQVYMTPGYYKISLEHTKPGIDVKHLLISSKVFIPVSVTERN